MGEVPTETLDEQFAEENSLNYQQERVGGSQGGVGEGGRRRGEIQVILGPMFSGKTTELQRRIRRYKVADHQCLIVKYLNDTRYSETGMATHDRQTMDAVPCTLLDEVSPFVNEYDVIGIDEGQFFPDLVQHCEAWAKSGQTVIVAALDGTFQRRPFGSVLELIPLSEQVTKLSAVCVLCYNDASFTRRLGSETKIEVIGGAEKYLAVCRKCFSLDSSCLTPAPLSPSPCSPLSKSKGDSSQSFISPQTKSALRRLANLQVD